MTDTEVRSRLYKIADSLEIIRDSLRGLDAAGQMHLLQLLQRDVKDLILDSYRII